MTHFNDISVQLGPDQDHQSISTLAQFKQYLITEIKLDAISQYLPDMRRKTFFLLAATGLGKTVIVPLHSYLEIFNRVRHTTQYLYDNKYTPKVFVIVPTITIAEDQVGFLNSMYDKFCEANGYNSKHLFGCKTAKGGINHHAPIQFLTTGVFEAMASNNSFQVNNHSILIDEAHKTLETSPTFEIALTNTRYREVRVDYMSATVDTTSLQHKLGVEVFIKADAIRHPIYKTNTYLPLVDSIVDIIGNCICDFNPRSKYIPHQLFQGRDFFQELSEQWRHRPSAMLVIVNSKKDIEKVSEVVRQSFPGLPILNFSSAVKKNKKLNDQFNSSIAQFTRTKTNYLIISTNVVEMGVTFDNLDWVVTKDQEYSNNNNQLELTPLKVNALYQRLGRVGRKGLGMGIITNDGSSYYSSLPNSDLNSLTNEPIDFPLTNNGIEQIAMNSLVLGWSDLEFNEKLIQWNCPSQVHRDLGRVMRIMIARETLKSYGITDNQGKANNHGLQVQQVMNYTGLSAYNTQLILEAIKSENWSDFSFHLTKSIVERLTFSDFGITKSENCEGSDFKLSVVELYNYLCDYRLENLESRFFNLGATNSKSKIRKENNAQVDLIDSIESELSKADKVFVRFQSDLNALATALYNALVRTKKDIRIPILKTTKQGKDYEVTNINLQPYYGPYNPESNSNCYPMLLTGIARITNDGRNFTEIPIPSDTANLNPNSGLEYQCKCVLLDKIVWVSPLHFTDINIDTFKNQETFYIFVKTLKDKEGNEALQALHISKQVLSKNQNTNLSNYIDPEELEYLDECQSLFESEAWSIYSSRISNYFQTTEAYFIALDEFTNLPINSQVKHESNQEKIQFSPEVFENDDDEFYYRNVFIYFDENEEDEELEDADDLILIERLDSPDSRITSVEESDFFQNTDEYQNCLLQFIEEAKIETESQNTVVDNNDYQSSSDSNSITDSTTLIDEYLMYNDLGFLHHIDFDNVSDPQLTQDHRQQFKELQQDTTPPNQGEVVITSVDTRCPIEHKIELFTSGAEYYTTLPDIKVFNLENLKLLVNQIKPQSPHLKKLIFKSPTGQFEIGLNRRGELKAYSIIMDQECNLNFIGSDLLISFHFQPAQEGLSYYLAKDIYTWFGYDTSNITHPDCLEVLYTHLGKIFYVGKTSPNTICTYRIGSNEIMAAQLQDEQNLKVYCAYTGKTYTVFGFVKKYFK